MDPLLASVVRTRFTEVFQSGAHARVAVAPGRVNLIGEHTDYNDGHVLPMAIGRSVVVAFQPREDRLIRAHALAFGETRRAAIDGLAPPGGAGWMSYVSGVAWALESTGRRLRGLDLAIHADLPIGAGLSSSAALEVAVARAFCEAAGLPWDPVQIAMLCQMAENRFVGTACGLMDQFASAVSREGCALLLDCRSLESQAVSIPEAAAVVVMDTGVSRSLADSAYNTRRAACEAAVAILHAAHPQVRALRDVDGPLLESVRDRLDPVVFRRASHVVAENLRPVAMAEALRGNDLRAAGCLMDDSHTSLRDLFEVSCAELDLVTQLARSHPACYGARMTGAGFGGCAVALVDRDGAAAFAREVEASYRTESGATGTFFVCRPESGARLID